MTKNDAGLFRNALLFSAGSYLAAFGCWTLGEWSQMRHDFWAKPLAMFGMLTGAGAMVLVVIALWFAFDVLRGKA